MKTSTQPIELAIPTEDGEFVARYSEQGLCGLEFPGTTKPPKAKKRPAEVPPEVCSWHELTGQALRLSLAGQTPKALPTLDLSSGTEFQQSVWQVLRGIGPGCTLSYGQVAEAIGKPKAVRAVGGACGANPIPVLVPCHRVLAANHRLGGFSGGLEWKRKLLGREKGKG